MVFELDRGVWRGHEPLSDENRLVFAEVPEMRYAVRIVAIALIVVGAIWILQGVNVLPGSFMTGQIRWAYRGAFVAVAGLALLVAARRR